MRRKKKDKKRRI